MKVAAAKRTAVRWVDEVATALPGFRGAFFHGSINGMADEDPLPESSDVDIGVVLAGAEPPPRLGKTLRDGVLVEGAAIAADRVASAEQLLADYRLAPSFRTDSVIADPTGQLGRIQQEVARHFYVRRWVLARANDAASNCRKYLGGLEAGTPYPVQATCLLFAAGNLAHVLLAAGLRNPTVRRRYSAARALLASAGRLDVHETLLSMLGCGAMSSGRVMHHLDQMTLAFDRTAPVLRSEFPFASDLSEAARPVAVDGSRELLRRGEHREAVFWIGATLARCLAVLEVDGTPADVAAVEPPLRGLMQDLGAEAFEDMQRRAAEIEAFLPDLLGLAGELVAANPAVCDG